MANGQNRFAGKIKELKVKSFFYPAIITIFIAGCGSASDNSNGGTNSTNKNNANAANTAIVSSSNQPNPIPPVNQSNVNAANAPDANHTLTEVSSVSLKNLQRMKDKGKSGDRNAAPIPSTAATPHQAPDNSELSSTMNEKGVFVETRVFKTHPTLAKIEKSFIDMSNPTIKVYLKNGKVLTMPKGKIEKTESATADEILRAVGVNP